MKKTILTIMTAGVLLAAGCGDNSKDDLANNPLLQEWDTPFATPPFEKIKNEHYLPAVKEAIRLHEEEIRRIINNEEPANFENTIAALDFSGKDISRVLGIFYNLASANTNPEMQAIQDSLSPILSKYSDDISMNAELFHRVKTVWENRENENLNTEQKTLLEKTYKSFVRNGSQLDKEQQDKLRKVNAELSSLGNKFEANLLQETKSYTLVLNDKEQVKGLPQGLLDDAAQTASEKGTGKWVFTLDNPSVMPFLQYADNRDLRKEIYEARSTRCNKGNEYDNNKIVADIVRLRAEKAALLGYKSYADYILEERMAKTPQAVYDLLGGILDKALIAAKKDRAELQKLLEKDHPGATLEAWDWYYYAEKLRQQKYDFNEETLKNYLQLENVTKGCFDVINKLYGISFTERKDIPVYAKDVTVYECKDEADNHLGILYFDPYTRGGKSSGAWCNEYRSQCIRPDGAVTPIVVVCFNYAKATKGATLLTFDEASTVFHEMGHAIHQLLSKCTYPSVAGTNVPRDFVELPSQVLENWFGQPEVLTSFAKNAKGETLPQTLIDKMNKADSFNQGFSLAELLGASLLDMDFHVLTVPVNIETAKFEEESMKKWNMLPQIPTRYHSTYFSHVFGGGYAAGYYSYTWSAVLDADAFEAFKETGNIFDKTTADKFKNEVLSRGGSDDAMDMYVRFRGKAPSINALLKRKGL